MQGVVTNTIVPSQTYHEKEKIWQLSQAYNLRSNHPYAIKTVKIVSRKWFPPVYTPYPPGMMPQESRLPGFSKSSEQGMTLKIKNENAYAR